MLRFALTLSLGSFVVLSVAEVAAVITVINPSQDTFIDEGDASPFSANGSSVLLDVGRFSIFSDTKTLIQFDLGSIPAGAVINSASLQLFGASAPWGDGADNLVLSPITEAWNESVIVFSPSTGDSVATISSTANPVFSITTLVQSWVDGSTANHGVYIDNEFNFNASGNFHSSDSLTGTIPELTVDFAAIPESASGVGVGLLALVLVVRRRVV